MPYGAMSNKEVVEQVARGDYRLEKPLRCPEQIFEMMEQCWVHVPANRMSFVQIYNELIRCFADVLKGEVIFESVHQGEQPAPAARRPLSHAYSFSPTAAAEAVERQRENAENSSTTLEAPTGHYTHDPATSV